MFALGTVDHFMAYNDGNTPSHTLSSSLSTYNALSGLSYSHLFGLVHIPCRAKTYPDSFIGDIFTVVKQMLRKSDE